MKKVRAVYLSLVMMFLLGSSIAPVIAQEIDFEVHSDSHPRVFNPLFAVAPNGSVVGVWTSASSVLNYTETYIRYSSDGVTWDNSSRVIMQGSKEIQYYPACLSTVGNKMILFYDAWVNFDKVFLNLCNCTVWMVESFDNGVTWINAKQIDGRLHNYVLGTYALAIMKNGTLIYPVSWYIDGMQWASAVLRSDDNGVSWHQGRSVENDLPFYSVYGLDEPVVVELNDGRLYCLMRASSHDHPNHAYAISNDYGLNWSKPEWVEGMYAVDTTPAMIRVCDMVVAAWINRTDLYSPRSPLVLSYSVDDCSTWHTPILVDNATGQQMNDMSFCLVNDTLLLSYRRYNVLNGSTINLQDDGIIQTFALNKTFLKADIDKDGIVSLFDAIRLANGLSTSNPETDLNGDGITDLYDAIILSSQFGKSGVSSFRDF